MSNLNNRVKKLESASDEPESIHILLTYVDPDDSAPIGYRCGEVEIIREPDEAEEDFQARCHDSVVWPSGNSCHSFDPMYAVAQ
jgi:hypothetical protein